MVRVEVEAFAAAVGEPARALEDALAPRAAMSGRADGVAVAAVEIALLGVDAGAIADLEAGRAAQHALAAFAELARGADRSVRLGPAIAAAAVEPIALMLDARAPAELEPASAGGLAAPAAAYRAGRAGDRVRAARPARLIIGREVHADAAAFGEGRSAACGARAAGADLARAAALGRIAVIVHRAIFVVAP